MDKIPTLDDMLKIYSKKDLFHRIDDKQKIINGLRQQLAESEERAERNKSWYNEKAGECAELRQQLAEKQKEIEELKCKIVDFCENIDIRNKIYNQDKISFAVEQLEKVKELVEEKSMTQSPFGTQKIYASDVSAIIDNQIKQLKEGK